MERVYKKGVKKFGDGLRLHTSLEKADVHVELDILLTWWLSEHELKEKDIKRHLARYMTRLAELWISASTMEEKFVEH